MVKESLEDEMNSKEDECDDECDHEGHDHSQHAHNPFGNLDEETQRQIQELQMIEQSFQQLMMQKQAFQMELTETEQILKEIEKTSGEISRIIGGQVIIKTTKEEVKETMNHKKQLIDLRLKNIEKQEKDFSEKINSIRDEIMKKIQ
ncbi:MAG: prefoldin subunit [archaeon]